MRFVFPSLILSIFLALTAPAEADSMHHKHSNPAHQHVQLGPLEIHHVWSRATPPAAKSGAAYLVIDNTGAEDDTLKSLSTPLATSAMIHTTEIKNDIMVMSHVMALAIPAGGSVALEPGGYHIMLMGLKSPLKASETMTLTLNFEKAGAVTIDVPILPPGTSLEHNH